jgi:MOSC domain-containing protein YiiM
MTGTIVALWISPGQHRPMTALAAARAVEDVGLDGCAHARPRGRRQVLLVAKEVLDALGLAPGQIKENITTQGIDLQALAPGTLLQLGAEVVLEVTLPCEPCEQMEAIRPGLRRALAGRRGVLAKVRRGGELRVGDSVAPRA